MTTICGHSFDEALLPAKPRVLDVGARNFEFTDGILNLRPSATVLAIEPGPKTTIPEDLTRCGFNVTLLHAAMVGLPTARTVPYVCFSTGEGNHVWEAMHQPPESYVISVQALGIRDVTDASKMEHWDLIKLDCEGSEFGILENWPLGRIATQISVEFHDYKNPARWNDKYFEWLWTQLPDYEVVQHQKFRQGEAESHWDTLLRVK